MRAVLGREAELERVVALVRKARDHSGALILDGPPGIGKTALVDVAVDTARALGYRVSAALPTPAETSLAFAALGDLLRGVDFAVLSPAQRRVLEIALGRRESDGDPPKSNELGLALLRLIEAMTADDAPLFIVVDDVQWMDVATRDVLIFAMRRLPAAGVCVLLSERTAGSTFHDRLERISLRPLASDVVESLLREALPLPLARYVLDRVIETAAGNPLYALELGRTMGGTVVYPGRPIPVPHTLGALIAERFTSLPPRTMNALAATAMLARPTVRELADLGLLDDLGPADSASIITIRDRAIEFTHPVLASAAHDAIPGPAQMTLHRRLATVTHGTERCIHLALGSPHPDAAVAAELEAAASIEGSRGATAEAAELMMLALNATPSDDPARFGRMLAAGEVLFRAGRTDAAIAEIDAVVSTATDGDTRARGLIALASLEYSRSDDAEAAARPAREALALAVDADLRAEAHTILARCLYTDFVEAAEHAEAALAIIDVRPDVAPRALAQALNAAAAAKFLAGEGLDRAAFERAIALEEGTDARVADSAYGALAALLKYADELDESRVMLESLTELADPGSLPYALGHLPQLHLWAGRWDAAEQTARRHLDLAEETHQESQIYAARFNLAVVAAHRGDVTAAAPLARALYDDGRTEGVPWTERNGAGLLGFLAMNSGDAAEAAAMFGRYDELGELMRLGEPGYVRFHGDYLESLVALGELERATEVTDRLESRGRKLGRASAIASALRGRALVAAHRGERDEAFEAARAAIDALAPTALAYDQSRALLTAGLVARRFKERAAARDALTQALARFEAMGAASLAARARREIDRVGGQQSVKGIDGASLSVTERRVAALAAEGQTTRQIADALFISTKTVEANLTRVYRKVGVTNRTQLANVLGSRQT